MNLAAASVLLTPLRRSGWLLGLSLMADWKTDEAKSEIRAALKSGYKFQDSREEETIRPLFDPAELNGLLGR